MGRSWTVVASMPWLCSDSNNSLASAQVELGVDVYQSPIVRWLRSKGQPPAQAAHQNPQVSFLICQWPSPVPGQWNRKALQVTLIFSSAQWSSKCGPPSTALASPETQSWGPWTWGPPLHRGSHQGMEIINLCFNKPSQPPEISCLPKLVNLRYDVKTSQWGCRRPEFKSLTLTPWQVS